MQTDERDQGRGGSGSAQAPFTDEQVAWLQLEMARVARRALGQGIDASLSAFDRSLSDQVRALSTWAYGNG